MKRIATVLVTLCFVHVTHAQNQNSNANTQWKINGNNASTTDFMGTTNNQSLVIKTNNIKRATFDTQGKTIFDGGGEVIIHPGGLNRPILTNPIAAYMLKVGGSGHFDGELNTRQLFVQEYITFMKSLKGPRIDVDTIRMDSTRGIFGNTKIFGDVQIKQNLDVLGNTRLRGNLIAEKGLSFDGVNGISYRPATGANGAVYTVGPMDPLLPIFPECLVPTANPLINFGGRIQLFDPVNNVSLTMGSDNSSSMIDASGNNGLKINYYCKSNTIINWAWTLENDQLGNTFATEDGGTMFVGAKADFQKSIKIGYKESGEVDLNTSIEINQNEALGNGLKLNTWHNGIKFITINNTNFAHSPFTVHGDGNMVINGGYRNLIYFRMNDASAAGVPKESLSIRASGRIDINGAYKTDDFFVMNDVSTPGSPIETFKLKGNGRTDIIGSTKADAYFVINDGSSAGTPAETFAIKGNGRTDINASTKTDKYFVINDVSTSGSPVETFAINGNGFTQIKVTNPIAMDNVIDVVDISTTPNLQLFRVKANGHVFAREVEIRNTSQPFPDYVFANDYKLQSLSDVESYIKKNKHLPGFEKGEYYEKNGIKSSEMFLKQQEKIEELTLYIIELEKRMKAIEEAIKH